MDGALCRLVAASSLAYGVANRVTVSPAPLHPPLPVPVSTPSDGWLSERPLTSHSFLLDLVCGVCVRFGILAGSSVWHRTSCSSPFSPA